MQYSEDLSRKGPLELSGTSSDPDSYDFNFEPNEIKEDEQFKNEFEVNVPPDSKAKLTRKGKHHLKALC